MHILFAEDNSSLRELLSEMLAKRGHVVETVKDGHELIARLERDFDFDVILTDHNMPHVTGVEALRRIRNDERLKHLPVIVVSANEVNSDVARQAAREGGMFVKKSEFNDLLAALGKIA
ncbi:MAG: response regulator [Candidatus Pacebacteria bacterium]|nr:response regulator [Candidatus Paceibacterota bacterium]